MIPADVLSGAARWCTLVGDVRDTLRTLPGGCVQCCVTSPPYYGLRDYGCDGQIGLEQTPQEYVDALVGVFREVRRALADDGVAWLNLGDSYAESWKNQGRKEGRGTQRAVNGPMLQSVHDGRYGDTGASNTGRVPDGMKPKDLLGIPWRVAFALQADGWWLRSDVVWSKPNPMPESVTDRPTRAHEYVFLLTKSARYFYDAEAIRESATDPQTLAGKRQNQKATGAGFEIRGGLTDQAPRERRNARSVWTITPEPYDGAHFATMPPELARRCILAGSRRGDVILDPFGGAGTTALVAVGHGRRAILCELNPEYVELQRERLASVDTDTSEPVRVAAADFGPLFGSAR